MSFERTLTHRGETLTISEWSTRTGLKHNVIHMRLKSGWSIEKSLETPVKQSLRNEPNLKRTLKDYRKRREEQDQIREWQRTQPAEVDERREEGDIL